MKRNCSILLVSLFLSSSSFALTDACGLEWATTMTRRMGTSPARVVIVENAVEVEPNHWVSNSPKGGRIYINFGQDTGEVFARQNSDYFQWSNALVGKDIVAQWKSDSAPLSFRHKVDVAWSIRALPSYQGVHQWSYNNRSIASPTEISCRSLPGWTDLDGKNWYNEIVAKKGQGFWDSWISSFKMRPYKTVDVTNFNQWLNFSEGYTTSFDSAMCDTHLGSAIEFSSWRELYLDDWKFDVYETVDPSAVSQCPN